MSLFPVPRTAALTTEQVLDEYDRRWAKEKREQTLQNPPVPPLSRPKPKRQRQVAPNQDEKQSSNIGSWIFFIVIVLIILRACTEA